MIKRFTQPVVTCFLAGLLIILPVVVTVAVVAWVVDFIVRYIGPNTVLGGYLSELGIYVSGESPLTYAVGWIVVLGVIFSIGILAQLGLHGLFQRMADAVFARIPLVSSVYSTSRQMIEMLGRKDDAQLAGMKAVFCLMGKESKTALLALLVSPDRYQLHGQEYYVVIIPTAPVPFGGALLFVPVDSVVPAEMSVEGLISIYVSMGVSAKDHLVTT
jgi:uncharacterized membrane protein